LSFTDNQKGQNIMSKKSKSKPAAPQPIDYSALMREANAQSGAQNAAMVDAQRSAYSDMLDRQLTAVQFIAGQLDNDYTRAARAGLDRTTGDIDQVRGAASMMGELGNRAMGDLDGTEIERMLRTQAEQELALGRALSPEEERAAQQSARTAFSARGMAMGAPAASAEILNRDAFANARQNQRREFAGNTNQLLNANRLGRLGMAGNMFQNQGALSGSAAQLGFGQAQSYIATDPYQRALQSNLPGNVLNASTQFAGMQGQNVLENAKFAGQVAGFNQNMQGSIYNSWMNNQAGIAGGQMQANAMAGASKDNMTGQLMTTLGTGAAAAGTAAAGAIAAGAGATAVGGGAAAAAASAAVAGAVCWVAREAFGEQDARWRAFRSWLLRQAPEWFLRAYARHGRRVAGWLRGNGWAKPAVRFFMERAIA
jgi:hypothetical protein